MNKRKNTPNLGSLGKEGLVMFIVQLANTFIDCFLLLKHFNIQFPRVLAKIWLVENKKMAPFSLVNTLMLSEAKVREYS